MPSPNVNYELQHYTMIQTETKSYYAPPGTSQESYNEQDIAAMIGLVETHYNLCPGSLKLKNSKTGKPYKVIDGVSVTDIRKAILLLVHQQTTLNKRQITNAIGIDHSCYYKAIRNAKNYYDTKDEAFMSYFNTVCFLSIGARVKDVLLTA